tara:strand:+ start:283 stop:720 length:438 start_codon:yes stop_codon:yes gene_type:complete
MKKLLILNGPNLNLLGTREPNVYGNKSLNDIQKMCEEKCNTIKLHCDFFQSNNEGEIINKIQNVENDFNGLIINPAGFTHTSVAILDSLRAITKPKIEIHLSNLHSREEYRKKSITAEAVDGVICGFGANSYILAIDAINFLFKD